MNAAITAALDAAEITEHTHGGSRVGIPLHNIGEDLRTADQGRVGKPLLGMV